MVQVILAAVSSAGLFSFITFLIQRKDNKKNLYSQLQKLERDSVRTQLLIMMNHYPDDIPEMMKLAEHYFSVLHGDWYMTSIFNKWLIKNNIAEPEWFDRKD